MERRRSPRFANVSAEDELTSGRSRKVTRITKSGVTPTEPQCASSAKTKKAPTKGSLSDCKLAHPDTLARSIEEGKLNAGYGMVIGVDEAGRGPFAGPVVAAACFIPPGVHIGGVRDSKQISEGERESLYDTLTSTTGICYATCEVDSQTIDNINILEATMEAMSVCALEVCAKAGDDMTPFVLVDGNRVPEGLSGVASECLVGGDGREYCVAAASIIAKVTRDRQMLEYHKRWPVFGWVRNKGYGTKGHREAIRRHGTVSIHRRSFLKKMVAEGGPLKEWEGDLVA